MIIYEENKFYFLGSNNYYQLFALKNKNKFLNVFWKYNKNKIRKSKIIYDKKNIIKIIYWFEIITHNASMSNKKFKNILNNLQKNKKFK